MKAEIRHFIKDFLKELNEDNAAIFAGAGLSAPAGYVNWKDLLRPVAEELELNVDYERDLVALAQFHLNENHGNRNKLNQLLVDSLNLSAKPTKNHRILARLPIGTYWTTNYDNLIETALRDAGRIVDVKYVVEHLATTKSRRDVVVYKMHGDIDHPHEAVITRDDYEQYHIERGAFVNALSGDLVSKTFLFIGFGFTDPNLDQILSRVRINFKKNQRRHYCFFRKRTKFEGESEPEFENAKVRQRLVIEDLKRFNIKTLLVDEYDEITEALETIEQQYRRRTIFVSGSAESYEPFGQEQVHGALRDLGSGLVKEGFRIATGVGLGVGDPVLTGAIEQVYSARTGHIEDALIIRPFPRANPNKAERDRLWQSYREDLLSKAGICLFLLGNKEQDGQIVLADGMEREFQIAHEMGLVVLPIGSTGFMAEKLLELVKSEPDKYLPGLDNKHREKLWQLGEAVKDVSSLIPDIIKLLKEMTRN